MTFRLCFHLDARGRPCNRRVMKPFSFCEQHREKPKRGTTPVSAEYQRERKARLAQSGLSPAMEAA